VTRAYLAEHCLFLVVNHRRGLKTTGGATAGWLVGDCGSSGGLDSGALGGLSVTGRLPLSTTVALSGNVGRGVGACGAFSAVTLLAKGSGGATDAWSLPLAAVSLIGADCRAAGLLSAAILLIGTDCGAAGAGLPLPAALPPIDAICEPKVLTADSEVLSESASSHAQNATAQMPTVTNAPAATMALPNLMRPVAEACRICA
jgi:hypothetical protein